MVVFRSQVTKKGLTVTKGKGTGEDGWKGRDKGEKEHYDYHT